MKEQIRPLFIIGNKRSGTTLLMQILNFHPKIYISNESDIVWILYSCITGELGKEYEHDSPKGIRNTFKIIGKKFFETNEKENVYEKFIEAQLRIMSTGINRQTRQRKTNLKYIGDQKPFQQCDPSIIPFIIGNFPNPKFIHLIRHPKSVVSSCLNFSKTGALPYDNPWKNMSKSQILEKWHLHEKWVEEAKTRYKIDVIDIKFEELISKPIKTLNSLNNFLEIDFSLYQLIRTIANVENNLKSSNMNIELGPVKDILDKYY